MSLLSEDHVPFRLPPMSGADETDLFSFESSVGPNGENRREDVIKAQTLLARTGDFDSDKIFKIPTGWPSGDLYRSIKAFQKRHGKQPDGTLLPIPPGGVDEYGVGESLYALRGELGEQLAGEKAPTPQEVDAHYESEARFRNTVAADARPPSTAPESPVLSDEPSAQPVWQDGGQSAQVSPAHQQAMQQAAQATQRLLGLSPVPGNPPRDQYGVSEDEKKVGRELGNRIGEKLNLLNLAPQLVGAVMRDPQAFQPSESRPATTTSEPVGERDIRQTQTPPLVPPEVNDKVEGRPAEEREPAVEQLIPPEMKERYEGLEPFDQALVKELMLVFNKGGRKGKGPTRLGNADALAKIMDFLQNERQMGDKVSHHAGSRRDGNPDGQEVPEEYIKGRTSGGTPGSSWPDFTVKYTHRVADALVEEYLRFFSGKTLADGKTGVKGERDQIIKAEDNKPGELMAFLPKLIADRPDGTVSAEARAAYQKQIDPLVREIGLRFEERLRSKRLL